MGHVQNKNVSMINEHKRAISEKKNLKMKKRKKQTALLAANSHQHV